MAKTIDEIMNREVFQLRAGESCRDALGYLVALGIGHAAVTRDDGRPIGVVSWRDLVHHGEDRVEAHMTSPPKTIAASATIEEAACVLAEGNLHHLVVVDERLRVAGALSCLDVLRALMGVPVRHPAAFPHYDRDTGLAWSDDRRLDAASLDEAPNGPGVIALVEGGVGERETIVWAESVSNVRARLASWVDAGADDDRLVRLLARASHLRVRTASAPAEASDRAAAKLRRTIERDRRDAALR